MPYFWVLWVMKAFAIFRNYLYIEAIVETFLTSKCSVYLCRVAYLTFGHHGRLSHGYAHQESEREEGEEVFFHGFVGLFCANIVLFLERLEIFLGKKAFFREKYCNFAGRNQ